TAVFRLDEEMIKLMRASGCQYICIAIESGTRRVIKEIVGKPIDFDHAKNITRLAQREGIFVSANFIIGFPTETWQEIRESINFAEELNPDYMKLFHAIPLRNTRLWELCEEHGLFKAGFDQANLRWSAGQIETDEFMANDLTILRAYEWDRINFSSPEKLRRTAEQMRISVEELNRIRKQTRINAHHRIFQQLSSENSS
ncbi:MAG: radical SAM protein, partial [Proteobacteria bacterium]|nr:radical SAM protein [Pseudomonadota bacterium]